MLAQRTLREVCYGMQPAASDRRSFCPVGRAAGLRSNELMLVQGQALRGDQGLGGCASCGRGEDDNAKTLVPDDVAVELEQA
jgi:hypothetical protein